MQGKSTFTKQEAQTLRNLIVNKVRSDRNKQKQLRDKMRALGFYITDFDKSNKGFSIEDFERLVKQGKVNIK